MKFDRSLRQQLSNWWQGRSSREQLLLGVLAALAISWALIVLVIQPIWTLRREAIVNLQTYEALNARLRAGATIGGGVAQRQGSPAAILSASATAFGLAPQITPDRDRFRAVLTDAPYEEVMRWVADVERTSPLRFETMRLQRRPAKGFVSAEFQVHG